MKAETEDDPGDERKTDLTESDYTALADDTPADEHQVHGPHRPEGRAVRPEADAREGDRPEAGAEEKRGDEGKPRGMVTRFRAIRDTRVREKLTDQQEQTGYRQQAENAGHKSERPGMDAQEPDRERLQVDEQPFASIVLRVEGFDLVQMNHLQGVDAVDG